MLYSEIKELFKSLDSERELVELVLNNLGSDDFEDNNYRFIKESEIFNDVKNMYEGDLYVLGCFNAWFIADILNIDTDVIEAMQKAEAYEAIGKLIISMDKLDELIEEYISADGYGHALNTYDGNYEEIKIENEDYIYFRI